MGSDSDDETEDLPSYVLFCIHDRPHATWAWDLVDRNREFLRGIDSRYFAHVAESEKVHLSGPRSLYASAALRIAYSQGLETLMALLGATAQAPLAPIGWLAAYKNSELNDVVGALMNGTLKHTGWETPVSIHTIAGDVAAAADLAQDKQSAIAESFAMTWNHWAREFLDPDFTREYNALKHGSRATLGGSYWAIAQEHEYGVAPPPEEMFSIGGSDFGSTFFVPEPLGSRHHDFPRRHNRNWNAEAMVAALHLLDASIGNLVLYLRALTGDLPDGESFRLPDDATFDVAAQSAGGFISFNVDRVVRPKDVPNWTAAEILRRLNGELPAV